MDDLQYIPKESELVMAVADIDSLWHAIETHFGDALKDKRRNGFLSSGLRQSRKFFEDQGIPVHRLPDLVSYGIDVKRGMLCGIASLTSRDLDAGTINFVAVLRVPRHAEFATFLAHLTGYQEGTKPVGLDSANGEFVLSMVGSGEDALYMVEPEPGLTMVSNSLEFLEQGLFNRGTNHAHAFRSDGFYEGVRRVLRKPLPGSRSLFLFWSPRDEAFSPVRRLALAVSLEDKLVRLNGTVEIVRGSVRLIDEMYEQPPASVHWERNLGSQCAAVLVFQDQDVSRYLHAVADFKVFRGLMEEDYGGVLGELSRIDGFRRLVLAITGYREGLPELTLGIWADPELLVKLVTDLQIQYRQNRDRAVIEGALRAFSQKPGAKDGSLPNAEALRHLGFLRKETPSFFERYNIENGKIGNARFEREDFQDSSYRYEYKSRSINYLFPRINQNDLIYRPEFRGKDRRTLLNDRYRVACVLDEGILWLATNTQDLERLIDRGQEGSDSLNDSSDFRKGSAIWSGREKVVGFVNLDQMTSLGLLSPESEINDDVKECLLDLQDHPAVFVEIATVGTENQLQCSIRLLGNSKIEYQ
jgi:hypothetical protein